MVKTYTRQLLGTGDTTVKRYIFCLQELSHQMYNSGDDYDDNKDNICKDNCFNGNKHSDSDIITTM